MHRPRTLPPQGPICDRGVSLDAFSTVGCARPREGVCSPHGNRAWRVSLVYFFLLLALPVSRLISFALT